MDDLWGSLAGIQQDIRNLELQRSCIDQTLDRKRAYMDEILIEIRCNLQKVRIDKSQTSPLLFV